MVRVDDSGFEKGFQSPEVGGIILAIEDDGTCQGVVVNIGMETERVGRKGPESVRCDMFRRDCHEVAQGVILFLIKTVDFEELLLAGVSTEALTVVQHLGCEPASDTGQGVKGSRICSIQVQERNVDIRFQPSEDAVRHDKRTGKV